MKVSIFYYSKLIRKHIYWKTIKGHHPVIFHRKGVLKIFSKFTGKQLC